MSTLKAKLRKYFSGKLIVVQIIAGVGAFAGRSTAVYLTNDQGTWHIIAMSLIGSFLGYLSIYVVGYWIAFRVDYRISGRSMARDIFKLELVEQFPNTINVVPAMLTQAALIDVGNIDPLISVNVASWFGPHKIINFVAMFASNSLKKSWVDGTWSPSAGARAFMRWIPFIKKYRNPPLKKKGIGVDVTGSEVSPPRTE